MCAYVCMYVFVCACLSVCLNEIQLVGTAGGNDADDDDLSLSKYTFTSLISEDGNNKDGI